ncbi:hypothetical protein L0Y59_02745 [Candidatus Uhrbacteria bacterium]|nr:hypothetical protein [Candidatus Uhrbacteria bacterium]
MPIKRRVTATKRRTAARKDEAASGMPPRILSSDEKHELILAHAEARHPADPVQRITMWVGVGVCVAFVAIAWFSTVGTGIRSSIAGSGDSEVRQVFEDGRRTLEQEVAPAFDKTVQDVKARLEEAAAQQAMLDELMAAMAATGTPAASSTRSDLFRPSPVPVSDAEATTTEPMNTP